MIALSILLFFSATISLIHGMEKINDMPTKSIFIKKLIDQINEKNTVLCTGLDPDWKLIPIEFKKNVQNTPEELLKVEAITFTFLQKIVDLTEPYACCYKLQKACYEKFPTLMKDVIRYIKEKYPTMPVISDCKACDIANTMRFYIDHNFNNLNADAITVVPYTGEDVVKGFKDDPLKTGIVVVQTSNPCGAAIQNLQISGLSLCTVPLWKVSLNLVVSWNTNNNLMAVISGNLSPDDYKWIRKKVGQDFFILVPGVGAQGAEPKNFLPDLMNNQKSGVIVNASRSILYPYDQTDPDWAPKVVIATQNLKNELNAARTHSHL